MNDITGSPILIRYQKILHENPDSRVFAPLAEAYRKLGMIDKAQEILHKGISVHPKYALGYLGLAQCYADLEQYDKVYITLKEFAEIDRDNLKLQKLFADACIKTGHENDALKTLKYLLFINPKDQKVAELVTKLEETRDNADEILVPEKPSTTFNINQITSNPDEYDYDDWRQEDFAFAEKTQEIDDHNWAMEEGSTELIKRLKENDDLQGIGNGDSDYDDDTDDNDREYIVDTSKLRKDLADLENGPLETEVTEPVITHTLVDLYCAQGHLEKATEILEKILLLNPEDVNTQIKLKEIKQLMYAGAPVSGAENKYEDEDELFEQDEIIAEIQDSEFLKSLESKGALPDTDQSNDSTFKKIENKDDLLNYFDDKSDSIEAETIGNLKQQKILRLQSFLAKIKQVAVKRSQQDSGTTL